MAEARHRRRVGSLVNAGDRHPNAVAGFETAGVRHQTYSVAGQLADGDCLKNAAQQHRGVQPSRAEAEDAVSTLVSTAPALNCAPHGRGLKRRLAAAEATDTSRPVVTGSPGLRNLSPDAVLEKLKRRAHVRLQR